MDPRGKEVIATWERRDAARNTFKSHWQRTTNYTNPLRNDYIVDRYPGSKRTQWIYDSTPVWCNEQFAAGLHSLLTSPTLQWMYLRGNLERVDGDPDARLWMDAAAAAMYAMFNSPRRNFAPQSNELYLDIGAIGTAVMQSKEAKDGGVIYAARHLKECCFAENEDDKVDEMTRRWKWTARQAVRQWGKKVGEKVGKLAEDKPDEQLWFYHEVKPRNERNPARSAEAMHMPYSSCYVSELEGNIITESGFQELPYTVMRFQKITGEIYGRGPGMTALPDIQMLNELAKIFVKAGQKKLDPPLQIPDGTFIVPVRSVPGAQLYYRAGARPTDRIEPIPFNNDMNFGQDFLEAVRQLIARAFYVDLLRMPMDLDDPASEGKGSTATYWLQRRQKEMMALSPMLARVQADMQSLIERTFGILWRESVKMKFGPGSPFPPPPASLSGAKLEVEFVSPIAMAQRQAQTESIDVLVQQQLQFRQIDPQCPIYLDMEAIMRLKARDTNAPGSALKSPQQLQQEAAQAAEMQQQAADHAAAANAAGAAKDASAAYKNVRDADGGNDNESQEAA